MKTNRFLSLVAILAVALTFFACSSDSNTNDVSSLDGTYQMETYTLEISGNNYILKISGENYGKGNITYDASTFKIISTHAWEEVMWLPFEETVTGSYTRAVDGSMTMSWGIDGKYKHMNGVWTKISNSNNSNVSSDSNNNDASSDSNNSDVSSDSNNNDASSDSNNNDVNSLDGTYQMETYTFEISGNNYILKISGENYGKGNITYDASTLRIISTHAWAEGMWLPFEETVTGSYTREADGSMNMSWVAGNYSHMNGLWTKI